MKNASLNPLRRVAAFVVVLCALSMLLVPTAFTQGRQDFTLVNDTGVTINELYVSPHSSNDWEEDVLGQDQLADGESVNIHFSRSEKAAKWDLKVTDKEGNSIEWANLNLLEISKVTLHYENGRAWADVE
ncbi:MAG TPA: hypothetical protein VGX92_08460 [Pyrinomonadaceae bacterium]|jgi:hypothetical protein|nr:hypothetical protein [Pyrinomonadaceae bacterium]